uniref:Uncharacterized protein n=1 Tax=Arundo donax TaxID=35708 RepID=A0A0A9C2E2_ARUDO
MNKANHDEEHNQLESESSVASAIDPAALIPDLSIPPCQWANVAHLNHGHSKVPEEIPLVAREPVNNGGSGRRRGGVRQHNLVGRELCAALQEVVVVPVVENIGCGLVQVLQCTLGLSGRAILPRELTLHFTECVCSLEGDEISVVEVDVSELLLELVEGVKEVGEVVCALDAGRRAVSPAKQHPPAWSSREFDRDLGCEGEDVGAGDDAGARVLQRALDVVNHREAARRVVVGWYMLLALDRREVVVQQNQAVATS